MAIILTSKHGYRSHLQAWRSKNLIQLRQGSSRAGGGPVFRIDSYEDDDHHNDDYDDGLPAHSHQVGICHDDEVWEYDIFSTCMNSSSMYR